MSSYGNLLYVLIWTGKIGLIYFGVVECFCVHDMPSPVVNRAPFTVGMG